MSTAPSDALRSGRTVGGCPSTSEFGGAAAVDLGPWRSAPRPGGIVVIMLLVTGVLVTGVLVVAAVAAAGVPGVPALGVGATLALLVAAGVLDARSRRLPDVVVVAAVVPLASVTVFAALSGDDAFGPLAVGIVSGVVIGAVPLGVIHLVDPRSLGFGDVKLAAVIGAALGVLDPRAALVAVCIAAGGATVFALARHHRSVPFGPFLVAGAVVVVLVVASGAAPWS